MNEEEKNEAEKELIKKQDESLNQSVRTKQNNQLFWALFLMVSLVLILVAVPYINQHYINTFDYHGLTFQKTKMGELVFYSTQFPVVSGTGAVIGDYAVNLRTDPRVLAEEVVVNVTNDTIKFARDGKKFGEVYISLNPFMKLCDDSVISMAALAGFLGDSGLVVKSAYTDKAYARDHNTTARWCYDSGFDTVIIVTDGNESSITEIAPNCYQLMFKECNILHVSERFQLSILEEYAKRF